MENQSSIANKRLEKAEIKRRSYSHENPCCENLVSCKGCQKEGDATLLGGLCTKCARGLHKAQEFASSNQGFASLGPNCRSVTYTCARGHSWGVSFAKAAKSWCAQCRKIVREAKKQRLREIKEKVENENKTKQRDLFQEAIELCKQGLGAGIKKVDNFDQIFDSVIQEASVKAAEYAERASKAIPASDVLVVYKVLLLDPHLMDSLLIDQ